MLSYTKDFIPDTCGQDLNKFRIAEILNHYAYTILANANIFMIT